MNEENEKIQQRGEAATLTLSGHRSPVNCLTFSDDSMTLASGGRVSCSVFACYLFVLFLGQCNHYLGLG
jgi:hypothetical protein